MSQAPAAKISFVSLGCPKALVDSERIITRLRAEGYELARNHRGADLVLVNTCGFLDSAQAQVEERLTITMPAVGSISSTPEPAVREWSGQAGASGHPLMSVEAIRAAAGTRHGLHRLRITTTAASRCHHRP